MGSFAAGFLLHRGWFRSGLSTRARAGSINLKGIRIFRCVEFVVDSMGIVQYDIYYKSSKGD